MTVLNHNAKWIKQHPESIKYFLAPKTLLGEVEAENEWNKNGKPEEIFLHTDSYEIFMRKDINFLFGRRGSGKTAMINMLEYEIKSHVIKDYYYVWLVEPESAYHDLATQIRFSTLSELPQNELVHFLIKKWSWILSTSAMCAVVSVEDSQNEDIKFISNYLKSQSIIDDYGNYTKPLNKIVDTLIDELTSIDYTQIGRAHV